MSATKDDRKPLESVSVSKFNSEGDQKQANDNNNTNEDNVDDIVVRSKSCGDDVRKFWAQLEEKAGGPRMLYFKIFLTILFTFFVILFSMGIAFSQERTFDTSKSSAELVNFDGANMTSAFTVNLRWINLTPTTSGATASLNVGFNFTKDYLLSARPPRLKKPITIQIFDAIITIRADATITDYTLALRLDAGSLLEYPWDTYTYRLNMFAYMGEAVDTDVTLASLGFRVNFPADDVGPFNTAVVYNFKNGDMPAYFTGSFFRPRVSKIYPIVVVIGMWCIIVSEVVINYALLILRWRKVDNPGLLIFHGGLLFALPSLRNSMPFSPPLGSNIDFMAFYWAMVVAMFTLLGVSIRYTLDSKPEHSKHT